MEAKAPPRGVCLPWMIGLAIAAAILGPSIGAMMATRAHAGLSPDHTGLYAYDAINTTCADFEEVRKDPINVAFVAGAIGDLMFLHLAHHGYFYDDTDPEQRFLDHGWCDFEHKDMANEPEAPLQRRFHIRTRTGISPFFGYDVDPDPLIGIYSVGTAHYDKGVFCGHAVPENFEGTGHSGYVEGREDIRRRWVDQGEHHIVRAEIWANIAGIIQCTPDRPQSDGWVYFISMGDTDGDGCADGEELGPDENLGGRRNPQNFWDFFDVDFTGAVVIADIVAVASRFGSSGDPTGDPLSPPPPPPAYHPRFDRTAIGPLPWDLGPGSGAIAISDIVSAVAQFGHSCVAPP